MYLSHNPNANIGCLYHTHVVPTITWSVNERKVVKGRGGSEGKGEGVKGRGGHINTADKNTEYS